jgi:hypothetical protein
MPSLQSITEIEVRYVDLKHNPSLGEALMLLRMRWSEGKRDRETALRLAFLAWYSYNEPVFLTGLPLDEDLSSIFVESFNSLGGEQSTDAEVCFVFGIMIEISTLCMGNNSHWPAIGEKLMSRFSAICPQGLPQEIFSQRGAYGAYFGHMLHIRPHS